MVCRQKEIPLYHTVLDPKYDMISDDEDETIEYSDGKIWF